MPRPKPLPAPVMRTLRLRSFIVIAISNGTPHPSLSPQGERIQDPLVANRAHELGSHRREGGVPCSTRCLDLLLTSGITTTPERFLGRRSHLCGVVQFGIFLSSVAGERTKVRGMAVCKAGFMSRKIVVCPS